MGRIKELREKQARIHTEARAKLDEIKDDTPEDRAAEINREFDAMMRDFDEAGAEIERRSKLEAIESRMHDPDPRRPRANAEASGVDDGVPMTYSQAFRSYLRAEGNVGAMDPESRKVLSRGYSEVEQRAQTTTASEGGYTVPTEVGNEIIKSMAIWGPMYDPGITMEMMTSGGGAITVPTVDDTSAVIVKHTEGTTLTDDGGSDVTFGSKTLNAYPFNTEWLRVSKELVDDSAFNVEAFLGELLGERLGRRANTELTTGDGTGDPNGIVTASAAGKTAASATAVTMDEIIDLVHSVNPAYRVGPRTRFMMNDTVLATVRKLKDGGGQYLWQPSMQAGQPETLYGYPFSVNAAMPAMTTGLKPIVFGNFGKYVVRKVGMPIVGAIQDKDFWPGFGIAGYIRFDGELLDTAAVKHLVMA